MNNDDDLFNELESLKTIYNQIVSEVSLPDYMQEFLGDPSIPKTDETLNPLTKGEFSAEPNINQNPSKNLNPGKNINTSSNEEKKRAKYDGCTHSLPHEKNGPYTCSKCKAVFIKSQTYAAHVSSVHYKNETPEERKKRLAAKNNNRKLRPVQTSEGLTLVPASSSGKAPAYRRKKGK